MMIIITQTLSQKKLLIQNLPTPSKRKLDALPEETSSTAPSISLLQLLEQNTEIPPCSSSSYDVAHAKNNRKEATVKQQQLEQPEFYYFVGKGWFYKTCFRFSGISLPGVPCITKAGIYGGSHTGGSTGHLESKCHKEAIKSKQSLDTLA